jgi:BASS family bile acid:Na+ symporter
MVRLLERFTILFPVWVLLAGILALVHPPLFTWFAGPLIVWGLAVIMLAMGITLSVEDFRGVLRMPRAVAAGFAAQYSIMPFLGFAVARLLELPTPYAVGLILVACCPGGTASNVVAWLARANVALSVLMTTCSTLGAIVMTPLLTRWLAGAYVPVDAFRLFLDTVQIVLLPVGIGLALHHGAPRLVAAALPVAPSVSVVAIALICASIIGQNAPSILDSGARLLLAVFLLHAGGFLLGYAFAWLLGYDRIVRRTISIEVGMQNSGLGTALAQRNFPALPTAPVPCALSAVFHSVIGSLLAGAWRLRAASPDQAPSRSAGPKP